MTSPGETVSGDPLDFGADISSQLQAAQAIKASAHFDATWRDEQDSIEHDIAWATNPEKVESYARGGLEDVEAARIACNHMQLLCFFERVQFNACYPGVDSMSFDYDSVNHLSHDQQNAAASKFYAKLRRYFTDLEDHWPGNMVLGNVETLAQTIRNLTFVTIPEPDTTETWYDPPVTPLWIIGSHALDDTSTRYLAVSIDANLPSTVQNYRKATRDESGQWIFVDPDERFTGFEDIEIGMGFGGYDTTNSNAREDMEYFLRGSMGHKHNFGIVAFTGPTELKQPKLTVETVDNLRDEDDADRFCIQPNAVASIISPNAVSAVRDLSRIYLTDIEMLRFQVPHHLMRMATDLTIDHHLQQLTETFSTYRTTLTGIVLEDLFRPFVNRAERSPAIRARLPEGCTSTPEQIDMSPSPSNQRVLGTTALLRLATESSRIISDGLARNSLSATK